MEAKSRIAPVPGKALVITLAVLLAALALLAGGYAIRLATATSATPAHTASVSAQSGESNIGSAPSCYWVNGRRGC